MKYIHKKQVRRPGRQHAPAQGAQGQDPRVGRLPDRLPRALLVDVYVETCVNCRPIGRVERWGPSEDRPNQTTHNQTKPIQTQHQVNLAFLAVQYAVLSLVLLISCMCGYAWWRRPRRGGPRVYLP